LRSLDELADPSRLEGMARFGIDTSTALGVTVRELRGLARGLGKDHALAAEIWESGIHEARILASIVDDPDAVTERQMESWVRGFRSWDLCDQVCMNLFDRTPFAFDKALEWSAREPEFEKRAGFALMASAAVHRKDRPDRDFHPFLPRIRAEATDERNYVKKAVSWALRQIGKRSAGLHTRAIATAHRIEKVDSRSARWIARDVLRELENPTARQRFAKAR
jgi:3-methyladenine DNA glycosylase AlkD